KPSWGNVIDGVHNVIGVARGDLVFTRPTGREPAKEYRLDPGHSTRMMVRVRGLHLVESNVTIGGRPVSAGLFALVVTAADAARLLVAKGRTPKYYVPKCEHYLEARWWNRLFRGVETGLGLSPGTLRTTFLIETLPAAFQMEEILYETRERATGLNGGR